MKLSSIRISGEDYFKNLLKRYRITPINSRSCLLVSKQTNMTWKIEILSDDDLDTVIGAN